MKDGINTPYVKTIPEADDNFFGRNTKILCYNEIQRADKAFQLYNTMIMPKFQKVADELNKIYPSLQYFNQSQYDLITMKKLLGIAITYRYYTGKLLPKMTEDLYQQLLLAKGVTIIEKDFGSPLYKKIWADKMTRNLISFMDAKVKGDQGYENTTFVGYSGHDKSIFAYLLGYGLISSKCQLEKFEAYGTKKVIDTNQTGCIYDVPSFAANFKWELSQEGKDFYVRVLYNGAPVTTREVCSKFVNGTYCPYADFKTNTMALFTLPDGYYSVCERKPVPNPFLHSWEMIILLMGGAILLLLALLCLMCCILARSNSQDRLVKK